MKQAVVRRVVTQRDFDRFAALSRDDNPIHCDPDFARGTHFGATVAHGMFLYGLICGALTRRLDAPWMPVAQTLTFPAPTFAGDEVSVRLRARDSRGAFDATVEVVRDGRPVETAAGLSIVSAAGRGIGASPGPGAAPAAALRAAAASTSADARESPAPATDAGADVGADTIAARSPFGLAPGLRAESTRVFEAADLDEYAALCGDLDPLVTDSVAAYGAGLPERIVPGPLLSGMFSDLLGTRLPGRGTGWLKQSLRFLEPAHPGQALRASVEIVRVRPDKALVDLRSTVRDLSGSVLVDGESLVLVRNLERARG